MISGENEAVLRKSGSNELCKQLDTIDIMLQNWQIHLVTNTSRCDRIVTDY